MTSPRHRTEYRTRTDRRLARRPDRGVPQRDNVDRIANGVRVEGSLVHARRDDDGRAACSSLDEVPRHLLIRTTREVTCQHHNCVLEARRAGPEAPEIP